MGYIFCLLVGGILGFFIASCMKVSGQEARNEEEPFNVEIQYLKGEHYYGD